MPSKAQARHKSSSYLQSESRMPSIHLRAVLLSALALIGCTTSTDSADTNQGTAAGGGHAGSPASAGGGADSPRGAASGQSAGGALPGAAGRGAGARSGEADAGGSGTE